MSIARSSAAALALVGVGVGRWWRKRREAEQRRQVLTDVLPREVCMAQHDAKVARIAHALRARTTSQPLSLRKQCVSHQVPKARDLKYSDDKVDIRDLNAILEIDPVERICVAESGVAFVDLVAATMRHGLLPLLVPEFQTITIGGAVSGCSVESMSFRFGGFHDSCLEYEVITATGEVLRCTPEENALLFQMLHGAFGTLGILSKITFRLIPAKRFVHVVNERYDNFADYSAAIFAHYEKGDLDFMDGIIHSPREFVLCAGRFVDQAPYTHSYHWMRIYYQSTRELREDYLKTEDYLFRYDRGVTNVHPKSMIGRLLFGRFLDSTQLLRLAERFNWVLSADQPSFTLDVLIPFSRAPEFFAWCAAELQHFPLWCVPFRKVRAYEWIDEGFAKKCPDELFLDLAIYGMPQRGARNYYAMMEEKLMELGGIKTLISHNYYSEADFWKVWNRDNYLKAKAQTDPKNLFRDLYTKTCKASRGLSG